MSLLKLLICGGLIFIVPTFSTTNQYKDELNTFQLSQDIVPNRYIVELELPFDLSVYSGTCTLEMTIYHEVQVIKLHATGLGIYNTIFSDSKRTYNLTMQYYKNLVTLKFNYVLLPGDYTLVITYWGSTVDSDDGIFRTSYINVEGGKEQFVVSRVHAIEPQRLFPCWTDPASKSPFDIAITVPTNYTALSNMGIIDIKVNDEFTRRRFSTTDIMSAYHVGIVVAPYLNFRVRDLTIRCRREAAPYLHFVDKIIKNVTLYFTSLSDALKRYELQKVDHVAIPIYLENSLPVLGLVLYREADIMYNKTLHTYVHKMNAAYLVTRGVAHQYFANLVSPSWWSYLWLNEGITTLYALDTVQKNFKIRTMDLFVVHTLHECLGLDTTFLDSITHEGGDYIPKPIFSLSYYIKAPVILRMLQHIVTEKVLLKGIGIYLDIQYASANLTDFWDAIQTALRDKFNWGEYSIAEVMNSWITLQCYPILNAVRMNSSFIKISVQNIRTLDNGIWYVPLTLTQEISPNFSPENFTWLRIISRNDFVTEHPMQEHYGWLIINLQQVGYYRVQYDTANWYKIAMYLNSDEYMKIHALNRAQIIDDAFYFLLEYQIDLKLFLELTQFLSKETDFIVWYPMFKALEYMTCFFPFSESLYIQVTLGYTILNLFSTIEKVNELDLYQPLKMEIAKWKCYFDPGPCATKAFLQIDKDLEQKQRFSVKEKEWMYNTGSKKVSKVLWQKMFDVYINKPNNEILKYLAFSEDPEIIVNYMRIIKSQNYTDKMNDHDRLISFYLLIMRHIRDNVVFNYVLHNFYEIRPSKVNIVAAFIFIINHLYSTKHLEQLRTYVQHYLNQGSESIFTLDVKHEYYMENNIEFLLLLYDQDCENSIRTCVVEHVEKLIFAIIMKAQMRLNQIAKLRREFSSLEPN